MSKEKKTYFKEATVVFALVLSVLLFAMVIIRGQCINKGYELSGMASRIEEKRIDYESVEAERMRAYNKEHLFVLAAERGFVLMQEGKTYNVGR